MSRVHCDATLAVQRNIGRHFSSFTNTETKQQTYRNLKMQNFAGPLEYSALVVQIFTRPRSWSKRFTIRCFSSCSFISRSCKSSWPFWNARRLAIFDETWRDRARGGSSLDVSWERFEQQPAHESRQPSRLVQCAVMLLQTQYLLKHELSATFHFRCVNRAH